MAEELRVKMLIGGSTLPEGDRLVGFMKLLHESAADAFKRSAGFVEFVTPPEFLGFSPSDEYPGASMAEFTCQAVKTSHDAP